MKRNLAQKITMSLVAGALLFSNGVVWADTGTQNEKTTIIKAEESYARTDKYAAHTQSKDVVNLDGYSLIVEGKVNYDDGTNEVAGNQSTLFGGFRQLQNSIGADGTIQGGSITNNSVIIYDTAHVGHSECWNSTAVTLRGAYESILVDKNANIPGKVSVKGAALKENQVTINSGANVEKVSIYGADKNIAINETEAEAIAIATGAVTNNKVYIDTGVVTTSNLIDQVYGGCITASITGNGKTLTSDNEGNLSIVGGNVSGNSVTIASGSSSNAEAYGGYSRIYMSDNNINAYTKHKMVSGDVAGNIVNIIGKDTTVTAEMICGGYNKVTISVEQKYDEDEEKYQQEKKRVNDQIKLIQDKIGNGDIILQGEEAGAVYDNAVNIGESATVSGDVYAGYNTTTIEISEVKNGSISEDVKALGKISGIRDNSINVTGSANLAGASLYGANEEAVEQKVAYRNSLNFDGWAGGSIQSLDNFNTISLKNFDLYAGTPYITITDASKTDFTGTKIVLGGTINLKLNDEAATPVALADDIDTEVEPTATENKFVIFKIDGNNASNEGNTDEDSGEGTTNSINVANFDEVELTNDATLNTSALTEVKNVKVDLVADENNNTYATLTFNSIGANSQALIIGESRAAATAFTNQGSELIETGIDALARDSAAAGDTKAFAAVYGNASEYATGSHVKVNGWSGIVGVGKTLDNGVTYGAFFETGEGNYRTYNDFGGELMRGDGDANYNGGGFMVRKDNANGVYTEASLRAGNLQNELRNAVKGSQGMTGYDIDTFYYGAHVGVGKIIPRGNEGDSIDVYGKFIYTHHEGEDFDVDGDNVHFDGVDSERLCLGFRINEVQTSKLAMYYGAAWEYEFGGDSDNTVVGYDLSTPSLGGSTVIGEVGMHYNASDKWSLDVNLRGYGGQREGFSGSVQANYMF